MRFAVLGCGSIGSRHLRNLRALGHTDLVAYDPDEGARARIASELGIRTFAMLEEIWLQSPTVAVVASPNRFHVSDALCAARQGCHLFIEKPLSHSAQGTEELQVEVAKRNLVTMVGCNMRFHPGPKQVKSLLDAGSIGRVLTARIDCGSYLPAWRPQQDYRKSYSARADLGGGCILDCIHEIDLARWYLGNVEQVACIAGHVSSLAIDVEDVAGILCRHTSGAISELHLDYVRRPGGRGCEISGEDGSLHWTIGGPVRRFDASRNEWRNIELPAGWEVNQMYLDEFRHFIGCIEAGKPAALPVSEAIEVMKIALAAKRSSASMAFVSTDSIR